MFSSASTSTMGNYLHSLILPYHGVIIPSFVEEDRSRHKVRGWGRRQEGITVEEEYISEKDVWHELITYILYHNADGPEEQWREGLVSKSGPRAKPLKKYGEVWPTMEVEQNNLYLYYALISMWLDTLGKEEKVT